MSEEIFGMCLNSFGPYHYGPHLKRRTCRRWIAIEAAPALDRAKIDRERGIYPPVATDPNTRGFCDKSEDYVHPKYTLCKDWNPVGTLGTCSKMDELHTRDECHPYGGTDWKPFNAPKSAVAVTQEYPNECTFHSSPESVFATGTFLPVTNFQKDLRTFRQDAGNPLENNAKQAVSPDYLLNTNLDEIEKQVFAANLGKVGYTYKVEAQAPRPLKIDWSAIAIEAWGSAIGFCENGPCAHEKGPGCKNWFAMQGYKVGEERRKEKLGYATWITPREMYFVGMFPDETEKEREARREREWHILHNAVLTQWANYRAKQKEREQELRIRRNERLRIADILDKEFEKPPRLRRSWRATSAYLRSL